MSTTEEATAEAIAAWIEANWNETEWDGTPIAIPERIRRGEWRETTENGDQE